jgi:dienelactone hydrolase
VFIALVAAVVAGGAVVSYRVIRTASSTAETNDGVPIGSPITTARLGDEGPGGLLSATTMPGLAHGVLPKDAHAARVLYRSTDANTGAQSQVSGAVFTPAGRPPSGGWPVVAVGHDVTGIKHLCAPSLSSSLLGEAPLVTALLTRGYAVALSDYQGLGAKGIHPFLDARTAGFNVIDSVRALRATFSDVSNRWVALGSAQGGAAAWAAAEQSGSHGAGLQLVGSVAVSPTADMTGLVDTANRRALNKDQALLLQWVLASVERMRAGVNIDDFRDGAAAEHWEALSACAGPLTITRTKVVSHLDPEDLSPRTTEAADQLRAKLSGWALPQQGSTAPLLVVYSANDSTVAPEWTTGAINRACRLGDTMAWRLEPGGPKGVDAADQLDWIADRFAGAPLANACGSAPGAGAVVRSERLDLPMIAGTGARGLRVLYGSTEGDSGEPTIVSGSMFIPAGTPPSDGWPVIALGHGTTGIDRPCAPSLSGDLLGQDVPIASLLMSGFAVTLADYQGLGADGVHPYTDNRTAGLNIIDSVRALRTAFPGVPISSHWGAIGHSQGGGAVWAANEQAASYAPDLKLVGTVAVSPTANLSGMVDETSAGTVSKDQLLVLQAAVASLGRLHPDLHLDDYRRGVAAQSWDALSSCAGPSAAARAADASQLHAGDIAPATPEAADRLRSLLQRWALPQRPLSAPMSVVYGTNDTYIDPQSTKSAIAASCALGGTIVSELQPGKGHADVDVSDQNHWLAERFDGHVPANQCR